MGALFSIANTLVPAAELTEKLATGALTRFAEAVNAGGAEVMEFTSGTITASDVEHMPADPLPFEPIGLGKPLTVELLSVYVGDAPNRSVIDRLVGRSKPDLLVASGVKNPQTFAVAPRAINQIVKDIDDFRAYRPGALREGSAIVYHSPGLVDATTFVSFELVVDSFSDDIFQALAGLFQAAAGLPIFVPAASYLIAGSFVTKIMGKVGKAFLETGPFMVADEDIRFGTGGLPGDLARFAVFVADKDLKALAGYQPHVVTEANQTTRVVLVDKKTQVEYSGSRPYVIAAFDGRRRPELATFTPTHVTAALMDQFYRNKAERATAVIDVVKDSLKLYNDFSFRQRALRYRKELQALQEGTPEYAATKDLYDACLENIDTEEFKTDL